MTHLPENAQFTLEFRVFNGWRQFSIEKGNFLTNGSKRWQFFVLINARANGNIFGVKKSHISLRSVFFRHTVRDEGVKIEPIFYEEIKVVL